MLLDIAKAFSALSLRYVLTLMHFMGAPVWLLFFTERAFSGIAHLLSFGSCSKICDWAHRGLMQGNGYSVLLFCLVSNPLIWRIEGSLRSGELIRGYMDDLAIALMAIYRCGSILDLCNLFKIISGAIINIGKSCWIALKAYSELEKRWHQVCCRPQ